MNETYTWIIVVTYRDGTTEQHLFCGTEKEAIDCTSWYVGLPGVASVQQTQKKAVQQ